MKDAQGQVYWQWCNAGDFAPRGPNARWDAARRSLGLLSRLGTAPQGVPPAQTRAAADAPPVAVDPFGTWARVAPGDPPQILAGGVTEPEVVIFTGPAGSTIHDLAPTGDGRLLIALSGPSGDGVAIHDLLGRAEDVFVAEAGFAPDRIAVAEDGVVWVLDRAGRALRHLTGAALPHPLTLRQRADYIFQPEPLNADAPRLITLPAIDLAGPPIIDAAALPDGRLALLCLGGQRRSLLRVAQPTGVSDPTALDPLVSAFSVGVFGPDKLALLVPGADTAVAVPLPGEADSALPLLGLLLPLRRGTGGRFAKAHPGGALRYPVTPGPDGKPVARLVAPSRPAYARQARVRAATVEADEARTVWHRLYLEAHLPPGTGVTVLLAASDDAQALAALPVTAMQPHRFGAAPGDTGPAGVWLDFDSEKPFIASALGEPRKRDRCGLFSALIQAADGPARRLKGRFLRMELVLDGPGLASPRVHAIRVWGPRKAWRDRYLPDYLSVEEGPQAAGSDFLDRYLGIFEGLLTPLEDQVAASWRLTRPDVAPADALDWLAGWIGAELDSALSEVAKRRLLAGAVQLWRRRGTLQGFRKMLEIVTDGAVSRGELVVLEHYHLRRTFATILGADLSDETNPLTPWAAMSGNSHLGPTFFLGADDERAFFALFRPTLLDDPLTTAQDRAAALADVADFFDQHAHRITVLVHGQMDKTRRDLIARVIAREVPAHVQTVVADGPGSLVLALSALVSIDSRTGPPPPRQDLTIGTAEVGQAYLTDTPSLDPRIEGGA